MTSGYRVPYRPVGSTLGDAEANVVREVITSGETLSCGTQRDRFEQEFARKVGVPHAVSVTNCTVALEFATHLAGLQPGDEVIAATQTYQATVAPLLGIDVQVRFCDVDPNTLNIDPDALASLVKPQTRAIYLVHHGGVSADMDPIMQIADDHDLTVIEDCAHSLGGTYRGRWTGADGDIGCFSFQSYKNISTLGEGGMLTTRNGCWAEVLRRIRSIEPDADFKSRSSTRLGPYSQPTDGLDRHEKNAYAEDCLALRHPGTNATLAEPAAAVGRVQLHRLDEFVTRRRAIADKLDAALGQLPGIRVQRRDPAVASAHHLYTCFLDPDSGLDRDDVARLLDCAGIQIQLRYFPVHLLPEWRVRGHSLGECPVVERLWFHEQLNLPIYPQMEDWQVDYMIEKLSDVVHRQVGG